MLFEAKKVCIGIQAIGMKIDDVNRKTMRLLKMEDLMEDSNI